MKHGYAFWLIVGTCVVSGADSHAQSGTLDYPQWRGANRDGAAASFDAPSVWPTRLNRQWRVETGLGYATPIVVGDRVYTFGRLGDDEAIMALDAPTGSVVWRTAYTAPYRDNAGTSRHGPGPKSTPLFYDDKLYTLGINGVVSAVDAEDGTLLWRKPAQPVEPLYATALSPVADRGHVIFHLGGHDAGTLTAFDAEDGHEVWSWTGDGPAYASPMVTELEGVRQIVTVTQERVVGVNADTGELLWERPFVSRSTNNSITPIVTDGEIIVTGHNLGVTRFHPRLTNGTWSTETRWETDEVSMFMSNPVLVDETLYGLSHLRAGQFFAIDVASGATLWRTEGREATNSAVVMADDLLFLLNDDGDLVVSRTDRSGFTQLARYEVSESATWAQPAITGNRIFVKDEAHVTLWTVD
ncbi:MAG: PQQ-binding-like beta-propeller repeat protein [Acidobacteriota bacterium]|nr:PQQ-binding-like beta-propeller repeat protein [Acidobacteriota bacterium]